MTASRDPDQLIQSFFEEGLDELPDPVYDAVRDRIEQTPQRAEVGLWRTSNMNRYLPIGLAAAAAIVAIVGLRTLTGGLTPGGIPSAEPSASATTSGPSSAFDDVLNGFIDARVAGEGAEQFVSVPQEVPLLYATTSGAPYDRAEFEQVLGIEWPYGFSAFNVRLFAGDTEVEQLFFASPDNALLEYQQDGFGTDIAPTTENGQPLAVSYGYYLDEVTLRAAHPWIFSAPTTYPNPFGRLIPEGPGVLPTTDGGQRNGWDRLFLIADPALGGAGCQQGPGSVDAVALAEAIRSQPDLGATAPVAVSVGGAAALMMDVRIAAGTTISVPADDLGNLCRAAILSPVLEQEAVGSSISYANGVATGVATGDWMRLYLIDVPDGLSMRILSVAIVAPEASFQRVLEAAAPVVDSIEFHAP